MRPLEDAAFSILILAVCLAFTWILWPFFGSILWGLVTAVMFAPMHRRIVRALSGRNGFAALLTVVIVVLIVILPTGLIAASLSQEISTLYQNVQSGELDLVRLFRQVLDGLPAWAAKFVQRSGVTSLAAAQELLTAGLMKSGQFFAAEALAIGQSTFSFVINLFVMLYLIFFLLRDEDLLSNRIWNAIPLRAEQKGALFQKFATVIRATVKGDLLVAALQGAMGGLIFWILGIGAPLLWAVSMAFLSLIPAVGASLVWAPVAIYLLATGALWEGAILIAYGVLVIGLVDNILRPVLVGKDTKMPDYVVLISTLGGIETFGLNGFVIGPVIAAMFIASWDIYFATKQIGDHLNAD